MFEFLKKKKPQIEEKTATVVPPEKDEDVDPEMVYTVPVQPIVPLEDPRLQNATAELTVTMSPDPDEEPEETEVETDEALIPAAATGLEVKVFESSDFGRIRATEIDGKPWLAAKDVADALGYKDSKSAIADHVDEEDKQILLRGQFATLENHIPKSALPVDFVTGEIPNRGLTFINESGIYSLILSSKLPQAKRFKRWVTSEVLPAIHHTGGYIAGESQMSDEELLSRAVLMAQQKLSLREQENKRLTVENAKLSNTNMELKQQIETNAPKVRFAESFRDADGCVSIAELAKLLCERGYHTGEKRLFETLRNEGYLCKEGHDRNHPVQKYLEMAKPIFVLRASVWEGTDGLTHQYTKTMVTPAGITYFFKHFLGDAFRLPVEEKKDRAEASRESAAKGRQVLNEMAECCAEVLRNVLTSVKWDRTWYATMEEVREAVPELKEYSTYVIGRALKIVNVTPKAFGRKRKYKYPMPAALFEKPGPVQNTHAARTQLVRVIIAGEKAKGTGMTLMTADQFLVMHRDKLGDMSVANLEAAFRACGVESDTSYGTLLWKLPA